MHAPVFRLNAVTNIERHAATQLVRRAISDVNGWVTGFRQFSNVAVVLDLEIAASRLGDLYSAIEATGVALSPSRAELPTPLPGQEEMTGVLRLEFLHDEPDLAVAVPDVPG